MENNVPIYAIQVLLVMTQDGEQSEESVLHGVAEPDQVAFQEKGEHVPEASRINSFERYVSLV